MTDPKQAPGSVRDFVVETQVKPDGRKIHYYEWPAGPPDAANAERLKPASPDRRCV